jgi:competence protein ComEC
MNIAFLTGFLGALIKRSAFWRLSASRCAVFYGRRRFSGAGDPGRHHADFVLAAPLLKREADALTSLSASLLLLLILNPFSVGSIGLQLSFSATLGIIVCAERFYNLFDALILSKKTDHIPILRNILRFIVTTTATTAGALVFSVPLIALHFGTVSLIAPLSNIAVLWAVTLAFIGGIAAVAAGLACTPLGIAAAWAASLPARFVIAVITYLSRIPLAAVSTSNRRAAWLVTGT